ncbi:hypothetical protein [Arsenicicoccus dermatophilus]|uniref:hypothetical protein n=1 Tax=Arsenicicoccus dermatophilus TaxID=1076331 RepID=UPI001F4CAD63|nr:hypothetical protein [Arsenicicoccus dermatophilus]MCH8612852.1 hypothetical protein [Arsenicicoccus dermatophilus]
MLQLVHDVPARGKLAEPPVRGLRVTGPQEGRHQALGADGALALGDGGTVDRRGPAQHPVTDRVEGLVGALHVGAGAQDELPVKIR